MRLTPRQEVRSALLLSQRKKVDATESMIEMLGERLGSLDPLVSKKR